MREEIFPHIILLWMLHFVVKVVEILPLLSTGAHKINKMLKFLVLAFLSFCNTIK